MYCSETCLLDVKKMEPIDGMNRISKVVTSLLFLFYLLLL